VPEELLGSKRFEPGGVERLPVALWPWQDYQGHGCRGRYPAILSLAMIQLLKDNIWPRSKYYKIMKNLFLVGKFVRKIKNKEIIHGSSCNRM